MTNKYWEYRNKHRGNESLDDEMKRRELMAATYTVISLEMHMAQNPSVEWDANGEKVSSHRTGGPQSFVELFGEFTGLGPVEARAAIQRDRNLLEADKEARNGKLSVQNLGTIDDPTPIGFLSARAGLLLETAHIKRNTLRHPALVTKLNLAFVNKVLSAAILLDKARSHYETEKRLSGSFVQFFSEFEGIDPVEAQVLIASARKSVDAERWIRDIGVRFFGVVDGQTPSGNLSARAEILSRDDSPDNRDAESVREEEEK